VYDLYASLWEVGHHGKSFPHDDVWVVGSGEGLLKTRQLLVGKRRATSTLFPMSAVARLQNDVYSRHETTPTRPVTTQNRSTKQ